MKLGLIRDHKAKGRQDDELGAMDWAFIRRQCFEVDVASECANGGNYVRGTKHA